MSSTRILLPICALLLLATAFTGTLTAQQSTTKPKFTDAQRIGYAIGRQLATDALNSLELDGVEADADMLIRGFTDGVTKSPTILDQTELEQTLAAVHRDVSTRVAQERLKTDPVFRALAEENDKRSREFITKYAEKPDVKELPNGALYRVIALGDGAPVTNNSTILVSYSLRLFHGQEFDHRKQHRLYVNSMSESFRDIVTHMRAGDHWEIALPSDLAYAVGGRAPDVGPNEALLVDIRIDDVK